MTQKARTLFLYPMLKEKLREVAPELVPFTSDVEADGIVYVQSKAALEGYESRARKWPRMCKLLCGRDEQGEPCFLYSKEVEDGEEPTPFTAFVDAVAKECEIEVRCSSPLAASHAHLPLRLRLRLLRRAHTHLLRRVASCSLRVCLRECFAPLCSRLGHSLGVSLSTHSRRASAAKRHLAQPRRLPRVHGRPDRVRDDALARA